jgi:hypothetical protein
MERVAVCSMLRDSNVWHGRPIGQVDKFFTRLNEQGRQAGVELHYYLVEGGSKDDTWDSLLDWQRQLPNVNLFKHEPTGAEVASVVSEERFKNLSATGNVVLRAARDDGHDFVFWMESDLIPQQRLLAGLLDEPRVYPDIFWPNVFAVAPVPVFYRGSQKVFYDTWAFEGMNGQKWGNDDLRDLTNVLSRHRPMRSVGSCALLNGKLLRELNADFGEGCFPHLCKTGVDARRAVELDVTLEVTHPCSALVAGRLV